MSQAARLPPRCWHAACHAACAACSRVHVACVATQVPAAGSCTASRPLGAWVPAAGRSGAAKFLTNATSSLPLRFCALPNFPARASLSKCCW